MKYFITLFIIATLLISCNDSESVVLSKKEYQELKGKIPKPRTYMLGGKTCYILTGEDGHEFISNYPELDYYHDLWVIHYPHCQKGD